MQKTTDKRLQENLQKTPIITDLDQSDLDVMATEHRKAQKKRATERKKKSMHTISGNFNRSRSAECTVRQVEPMETIKMRPSKVHNYLSTLVKEQEMEKMLQRIVVLQQYNEDFAQENFALQEKISKHEDEVAKLQNSIENCQNCQKFKTQIQELQQRKKETDADINMLQNLVFRLNAQIEAYQDQKRHKEQQHQLTTSGAGDKLHAEENTKTLNPTAEAWQLAFPLYTKTLGPLLRAYDEVIHEKDELFAEYKTEFDRFSGELKRVIEEYNTLLEEHEQLKRDVGSSREERARNQAALEVCRKRAEAHAQKADLAKEKLIEVVSIYEQRLQTVTLDAEHLNSAYVRCKSELVQLKNLQAQPPDAIAKSLQECKELLERLKDEHDNEKKKLQELITELNKRCVENEGKIAELQRENDSLKKEILKQLENMTEYKQQLVTLKDTLDHVHRSRGRLKARLRIALQWAQNLEKSQAELQGTWDAVKRLEMIVKHKESQVRGLQSRHLEEIDKLEKKLVAKESTIRNILKSKVIPKTLQMKNKTEDEADCEDS